MEPLLPFDERPYREGVGILLLNPRGMSFVARRNDIAEPAWQFPQGGIAEGESPMDAARRTMLEEIGVARLDAHFQQESGDWFSYDLPRDLADRCWDGRFRGQRQKWFAFRFAGRKSDINLETGRPVFSEWKWTAFRDTPPMVPPFKRPLYDQLIPEFEALIHPMA